MGIARRGFLKTFGSSMVSVALDLDVARFFGLGRVESDLVRVRGWFVEEMADWVEDGMSYGVGDLGRSLVDFGLSGWDLCILSAQASLEFDFDFFSNFDAARIQNGEDLVVTLSHWMKGEEVPLELLNRTKSKREYGIICENTFSALVTLGSDVGRQLERIGPIMCPGCALTGYYGEWLRRFYTHGATAGVREGKNIEGVLAAIERLGAEDRVCVDAGSAELLLRPGWGVVREEAGEALRLIRGGK